VNEHNRLQLRSERAVSDIVVAARERFGTEGYAATSVDDIAADAGRTKGAVYHHFRDKADLFARVFTAEQWRIAGAIAEATRSPDPIAVLADGVADYLGLIARSPLSARITLIDGPGVLGWQEWRSCGDGPFRTMLRDAIGRADDDGQVSRRYSVDLLAELMLGAVTEAAHNVANSPDPLREVGPYQDHVRRLVRDLIGEQAGGGPA
jgi:AcrR family transcriptional regulator